MNLITLWNKFWFSESPYFDLAFIRIIIVAFSLYYLFSYTFNAIEHSLGFANIIYSPIPMLKMFMLPFGWGARPEAWLVYPVFWITVLAGLLALIGLLTNLSLFLFALGNIFMQAFIYSFGDPHHPDAIMNVTLLAFSLAPCGKVLSVDYMLKQVLHKNAAPRVSVLDYKGIYAGWPIKMMQIFFALMYLSAISSKMVGGGVEWANGYTLQYHLLSDSVRKGVNPLGEFFAQFHYFVLVLQWVVLFFQATFFLSIFYPLLRWIYLPIGLCFHFGIYLTLHAWFPQWILLYILFIPWSMAFKKIAGYQVSVPVRSAVTSSTDSI